MFLEEQILLEEEFLYDANVVVINGDIHSPIVLLYVTEIKLEIME